MAEKWNRWKSVDKNKNKIKQRRKSGIYSFFFLIWENEEGNLKRVMLVSHVVISVSFDMKIINKSNARDTTNFTTKCLQTDMTSYMDITHQQLILNVNIELVIWCFNYWCVISI